MRPSVWSRLARALATVGLIAALAAPASSPALGADDALVIRAGTDQKSETLNPWHTVTVADYEVFTLKYDLLVGFEQNLELVPGFAESWSSSDDQMTHTVRDPAGPEVVRRRAGDGRGRPLDVPARPRCGRVRGRLHRLGLPRRT